MYAYHASYQHFALNDPSAALKYDESYSLAWDCSEDARAEICASN